MDKTKFKKFIRIFDRVAGFVIVTVLIIAMTALGAEYVCLKGPSEALKSLFTSTFIETSHWKFIPNIFLSDEEVKGAISSYYGSLRENGDDFEYRLVGFDETEVASSVRNTFSFKDLDDDGDGIVRLDVKGKGFTGYMIAILDPSRVFTALSPHYPGYGSVLDEYCEYYGALGGINGGGYYDPNGAGTGGLPQGLTIVDGQAYNAESTDAFVGIDGNNKLIVGYLSLADLQGMDIRCGVSFGPPLIINGKITKASRNGSGVNPRTAIAQTEDGTILMLAVDGRQINSMGATYEDCAKLLMRYGAINACNLDGGSSTSMFYNGEYVNNCSSQSGTSRYLASAFLFK